jgi:hypothetical protein
VLNKDFFTIEQEAIRSIESVLTVTNGKVVYGAEEFADLAPELPPAKPAWSPVNFYDGYFRYKLHESKR